MVKDKIYIVTINYYNKKYEYRKMLTTFINPNIEITMAYILNSLPTINKNDIYLIDNIEIEMYNN